tara:strand:+ start:13967 stop:14791 length:825 start_codon:yes stop_codon:yes gene_type:complete
MAKNKKIEVDGLSVTIKTVKDGEYISLTDIARRQNPEAPADVIKNWLRSKNTILLLGLWEKMHNTDFKLVEFDQFKNEAGMNHFVLSPQKWIETTNAIGINSKSGRYGGTFAHSDIAMEFASWVSVEFKLYLIKEYQFLKSEQAKEVEWNVNRHLTKINYCIHTDAIKQNLIPPVANAKSSGLTYASEADLLNLALFGKTAKQWRDENPDLDGNIQDHANVTQLVCLANLESLNATLIENKLSAERRLEQLNATAIKQLTLLLNDTGVKRLIEE